MNIMNAGDGFRYHRAYKANRSIFWCQTVFHVDGLGAIYTSSESTKMPGRLSIESASIYTDQAGKHLIRRYRESFCNELQPTENMAADFQLN